MEQFTYKGHSIEVHYGYNGKSIYIRNAEGVQIYAHKFTGSAMDRAKMILGEEVQAVTVTASAVPAVSNAIHTTNDGRRINIADLTDEHLTAILPKVRFSIRRFMYVQEAKKRGIYKPELTPAEIYQSRVNRILQQAA